MTSPTPRFLSILLLCSGALALADGCVGSNCNLTTGSCANVKAPTDRNYAKTHWTERAQGQQYFMYGGAGIQDKINLPNQTKNYSVFDITLLVEQTANSSKVATFFGGISGNVTVGAGTGSKMPDTDGPTAAPVLDPIEYSYTDAAADIRASDLGLAQDTFTASVCFKPQIRNIVLNFDWWNGWDKFVQGLYTRVRVPFTISRWSLGATQASGDGTTQEYVPGFINSIGDDGSNFYDGDAIKYVDSLNELSTALSGQQTVGDIPQLTYGRICGADTTQGVADLPVDIGYNFILTDRSRLGASLHVVLPTGTKSDGVCIFSPRVGYDRWQVGTQIGGQYRLRERAHSSVTVYAEAMVAAMLGHREQRLLGLKSKNTYAFNHLLLLKKFTATEADGITATGLERAANLLYQQIDLATAVNSDAAVWLQYKHRNLEFDIAWQFVGRGAEQLKNVGKLCGSCGATNPALQTVPGAKLGDGNPNTYYVIKGDTPLYLPIVDAMTNLVDGQEVAQYFYNKSNSNISTLGTIYPGTTEPAIDNNTADFGDLENSAFTAADVVADPALQPAIVTNAVAFYIGYTWPKKDITPMVGLGGFFEHGATAGSMDMWGVFVKGGFTF